MTDAKEKSQEVYIFDDHSDQQQKQEWDDGKYHNEASSPTHLKPIKTYIKSARLKALEGENQSSMNVVQTKDSLMKLKAIDLAEGQLDLTAERNGLETPKRLQHERQPIATDSSPDSRGKWELKDELEMIQFVEDQEVTMPKMQRKIQVSRVPNILIHMQPEVNETQQNELQEENDEQQQEQSDQMSSVDEGEYLDQLPLPSQSVERDYGVGSLFKIKEVPTSSTKIHSSVINLNRQMMYEPLELGTTLSCWLIKNKTGLLKTSSVYKLYSKNEMKLIMAAKKLSVRTTSQYLVSLSPNNISPRDKNYLGYVKSNFFGTQWSIYDSGELADKAQNPESVRKQLAYIQYQFNLFGMNGPRKMEIVIPRLTKGNRASVVRSNENQNRLKLLQEENERVIMRINNKAPSFDQRSKVFILDFKGKVKEASVKNFILYDSYTKRDCMLFGKHSEERYLVQFSYPLSPMQALGICLSSIDRKLMVE